VRNDLAEAKKDGDDEWRFSGDEMVVDKRGAWRGHQPLQSAQFFLVAYTLYSNYISFAEQRFCAANTKPPL